FYRTNYYCYLIFTCLSILPSELIVLNLDFNFFNKFQNFSHSSNVLVEFSVGI
ncbi:hypothetical protein LINPERHAP2_LOCUS39977, partial [Linum perenne]